MPEVEITEQQHHASPVAARDDVARAWGEHSSGRSPGRSAKKRQAAVQALVRRMQAETRKEPDGRISGPLRPCTVVNFNPVALVVEGQLRITVQKPGTTEHHQIKMPYRGRLVPGHYCYIASPMATERPPDKEPIYYTVVTGHEVDSVLPIDVPTVDARVFTPHSIGCELWSQYNSASHKLMGGILMFDQGPHVLKQVGVNNGRIYVPERSQMDDTLQYAYRLREAVLDEELDRIFKVQSDYCSVVIQQAHTLWAEQDVTSRKMVTDTHRAWARYAQTMGWLEALPEWVNAALLIGDKVRELRPCKYCGTQQASSTVYFCTKCNAPYDPFKAFMDGLNVPIGFLETLEGEELDIVVRKLQERKSKFSNEVRSAAEPLPAHVTTAPALNPTHTDQQKPQTKAEKAAAKAAKATTAAPAPAAGEEQK